MLVCAIERLYNEIENVNGTIEGVIGVAGEYGHSTGAHLDPKWTRLSTSVSPNERKNGLRLEMNGAKYKDRKQKAVIDFICPQEKKEERRDRLSDPTALADDGKEDGDGDEDEEDPSADAEVDDGQGGRLKFLKYEDVEKGKILNLEWTTTYACEDANADPVTKTGHWGFFTWLIIMFGSLPRRSSPSLISAIFANLHISSLILGAVAYLLFGSWLNYNRYSARGWDLLPHSEAIRDIPYLLRDWMRRVVNTIQGGGSRGGYSAV